MLHRLSELQVEPGLCHWAVAKALAGHKKVVRPLLTRKRVAAALEATGGNREQAAQRLGVHRGRILRYLQREGGRL